MHSTSIRRGLFLMIGLILSACSTGDESNEGIGDRQYVDKIEHVHDMAFDREGEGVLYVGTHHGLVKADLNQQEFTWTGTEQDRHDFMGFLITPDNTFVSSGHPGHNSKLENPLGVMFSDDRGDTWKVGPLYGEVDFHLMTANESEEEYLYGFDAYGGRLYASSDSGREWSEVSAEGIQDRFNELYSITSDPDDPDSILAGMSDGIYLSKDGGQSFKLINNELTVTSVVQGPEEVLYAHGIDKIEGLMRSDDFGQSWEPFGNLPEDAAPVLSLSVDHQNFERIAIGTASDSIYVSEDLGESWDVMIDSGEIKR